MRFRPLLLLLGCCVGLGSQAFAQSPKLLFTIGGESAKSPSDEKIFLQTVADEQNQLSQIILTVGASQKEIDVSQAIAKQSRIRIQQASGPLFLQLGQLSAEGGVLVIEKSARDSLMVRLEWDEDLDKFVGKIESQPGLWSWITHVEAADGFVTSQ